MSMVMVCASCGGSFAQNEEVAIETRSRKTVSYYHIPCILRKHGALLGRNMIIPEKVREFSFTPTNLEPDQIFQQAREGLDRTPWREESRQEIRRSPHFNEPPAPSQSRPPVNSGAGESPVVGSKPDPMNMVD